MNEYTPPCTYTHGQRETHTHTNEFLLPILSHPQPEIRHTDPDTHLDTQTRTDTPTVIEMAH